MDTNKHRYEYALSALRAVRTLVVLFVTVVVSHPSAGLIADGKGVFRVAVATSDAATGKPLEGVKLTMKEAGADEIAADSDLRRLLPMLAPRITGEFGDAFVYYFGGFSEETARDGQVKRTQGIRGKLLVEKEGYHSTEVQLTKVLGSSFDTTISIPFVELRLKPKTH